MCIRDSGIGQLRDLRRPAQSVPQQRRDHRVVFVKPHRKTGRGQQKRILPQAGRSVDSGQTAGKMCIRDRFPSVGLTTFGPKAFWILRT